MTELESAYLHWDRAWRTEVDRADWSQPEPWVLAVADQVASAGGSRVLDLGCGVGRHALALAERGFAVRAVDRSPTGVEQVRAAAAARGLDLELAVADFTELPYETGSFDFVLAWDVVYHGDPAALASAVHEVSRVLRPGGVYQSTMLSKRNHEYGKGVAVAEDTFVQPDGPDDKAYPHLYCDAHDVLRRHPGFALVTAYDAEHDKPGSFHWHLLFESEGDR